jgi:hypothetical protein
MFTKYLMSCGAACALAVAVLGGASARAATGYTPYENYQGYASYQPARAICATNPSASECNGTQAQCEAYPSWSQCNGTLAQCTAYPSWSQCNGTYVQCTAYPSWSQCNGTRVQCEAYPSWSQCNGTRAQCDAYPSWSQCANVPAPNPCDVDRNSQACLNQRCQTQYSPQCRDIFCQYNPNDGRCASAPNPPPTPPTPPDRPDPEVDAYCRSHGYRYVGGHSPLSARELLSQALAR